MRVRAQCKSCGLPFGARLEREQAALPCPNCQELRSLDTSGWKKGPPVRVERCLLCGSEHLYSQRDINRALGCGLIIVGAVFVPWTYGLSLIVLSLVDLGLYYWLPKAVVCYRCDTVYRDARPGPRQGEFDLLKHDVVKYGKTWELVKPGEKKARRP